MKLIKDIPDIYCNIIEEGLRKPNPDRLSVTELINPPLIKHLQLRYWDKIQTRASDYLWMILGKAVHQVFESGGIVKKLQDILNEDYQDCICAEDYIREQIDNIISSHFAEKPIRITLKNQIISGRMDFRELGIIRDFKVTSVWSFLKGIKPEWERQLNVYAFMAKKNGIPVDKIFIDAILRDWSKVETFRNPTYPKMPFISLECNLWSEQKQYDYIMERISLHNREPSECSPEEKWEKPTVYAVKKPNVKRATRVFSTAEEALMYINERKDNKDKKKNTKLELEVRQGECTRCLYYCPVKSVCPFNDKKET